MAGILVANEMDSEKSADFFDMTFNLNIHPKFNIKAVAAKDEADLPTVLLGITVDAGSLFVPEFFEKIFALKYPKSKLDVFVACHSDKHLKVVQQWKEKSPFNSITLEDQNKGNYLYFFRLERAGRILLLGEARYTSFVVFFYLPPLGNLLHPTN